MDPLAVAEHAGGRGWRPLTASPIEEAPESAQPGFVKRHPILAYHAVVFAISWGGLALLIAGRTDILATL